jgi:hypothetical protein
VVPTFLIEADVVPRTDPTPRTHLGFFTVLVVSRLPNVPDAQSANELVSEYLRESRVPLEFDFDVVAVEEISDAPALFTRG